MTVCPSITINGLAGLLADCERRHGEEIALGRAEPAVLETLRATGTNGRSRTSEGWHTGNHDLEPFFRFHLQTLVCGYSELDLRRERVMDPVGVVFSSTLGPEVISRAQTAFAQIYPNATFSTKELRAGKAVEIEGHRADLPKEEWEKGRRALKLIESLLARAQRETQGSSQPG